MSASSMSHLPAQLSMAGIDAMSQRQIKKHHVAIILLHWFNAIVWLLGAFDGRGAYLARRTSVSRPTGICNIVQGSSVPVPTCCISTLRLDCFGRSCFWRTGHLDFGPTCARKSCRRRLPSTGTMCAGCWCGRQHDSGTKDELPPQGVYNAGQKLFAILVYMMVPLVMISGVIMSFHLISTTVVAWAVVIHFFAVGMVVSGL